MSEKINLGGRVTIYQEDDDGNREYICKGKENHFTKAMIRGLFSYLCGNYLSTSRNWIGYAYTYGSINANASFFDIAVGNDTTTMTGASITDLISKNTIIPTVKNIEDLEIDGSYFNYKITATWQRGVISGTVGEIGLYSRPFNNISTNWVYGISNGTYTYPTVLCARYAVADGNMESFVIDETKSLVIRWDIGVFYE